ncbi:MAG: RNA polymerase sigma factor [Streptosporangiaceae bacterium]
MAADTTAQGLRGALAAALAELPPGDRDVLVLVASEQLTYEETANALAIPVGTVRSRLHRARATVRQSLAANGRSESVEEILFT